MGRPVAVEGGLITTTPQRCALKACRGGAELESEPIVSSSGWESVAGLDSQQLEALQKVAARGVFWQHPSLPICKTYGLQYGGDVEADGNCLFTTVKKALQLDESPADIRSNTVRRFMAEYEACGPAEKAELDNMIKNLYSPNLAAGWGVHVVQELKLLARKTNRAALETEIEELIQVGMSREFATESVYNERCTHVETASSWAEYMSISGLPSDEYDIITLLYTEDGLLTAEMNAEGKAAAFGDDIAIQALANEFQRQIFVVQVHGRDGSITENSSEGLMFFLPHTPKQEISHPPVFLLMRGTGWCGAGGDHYEPILAKALPVASKEKAAFVL